MREIWKDVPGYAGLYQISDLGRLLSCERKVKGRNGSLRLLRVKILPTRLRRKDRRIYVSLWANNQSKRWLLHRLVLTTFVGRCPDGQEACHFPDRDPANCKLSNLRWGTSKANKEDSLLHGTRSHGDKNPSSKLKEADIPKILKRLKEKETIWSIAKDYGVSCFVIGCIRKGTSYLISCPRNPLPKQTARAEANGNSKLNQTQVAEIRRRQPKGKEARKILARKYGVNQMTIWRVLAEHSWMS